MGIPYNNQISLGEGNTPLLWSKIDGRKIAFKCEDLNPTGSFKDRGSAVLISWFRHHQIREIVEDSSGNAGASLSAYAARAEIRAKIYIPASTSGPKKCQIEAYGAEVVSVPGLRIAAAEAARAATNSDIPYASHSYLPFNIPGYATIAYELLEQMEEPPKTVILPAGQGGLLLGIYRGFEAACRSGFCKAMPQIIAVQAKECAPLWIRFVSGKEEFDAGSGNTTIAEGISIRHPVRDAAVMKALRDCSGRVVVVDEVDILIGRDMLAQKGLYVEPTSAVVWSAIQQLTDECLDPVVVILTGSGYKYSHSGI